MNFCSMSLSMYNHAEFKKENITKYNIRTPVFLPSYYLLQSNLTANKRLNCLELYINVILFKCLFTLKRIVHDGQ